MISIQKQAVERHKSIKDVLNEVLQAGLANNRPLEGAKWVCPVFDLGAAKFDYLKAWDAIDGMEADSVAEKIRLRK